jgi:hypothetical protein
MIIHTKILTVVVDKGRVVMVPTVEGVAVVVVVNDIAGFHISKFQNEEQVMIRVLEKTNMFLIISIKCLFSL